MGLQQVQYVYYSMTHNTSAVHAVAVDGVKTTSCLSRQLSIEVPQLYLLVQNTTLTTMVCFRDPHAPYQTS